MTIEYLPWQETGIEQIDGHHRALADRLAAARAGLGELPGTAEVDALTQDLMGYALFHFETEEGYMRDLGYDLAHPEAALRHLQEHREFVQTVIDLRHRSRAGEAVRRDELLDFIAGWMTEHIEQVDAHLAAYILARTGGNGGT